VQRRTGASERGHAIEEENNPRKLARAKGRAIEKEYRNFDKWKKPRAAENLNKTRRQSLTSSLLEKAVHGIRSARSHFCKGGARDQKQELSFGKGGARDQKCEESFLQRRCTGSETGLSFGKRGAPDQKCEQFTFGLLENAAHRTRSARSRGLLQRRRTGSEVRAEHIYVDNRSLLPSG